MLSLDKKGIKVIAGSSIISIKSDDIFSESVCSFLNDLSSKILDEKSIKNTDVKTFAFWLRKKNFDKYIKKYVDNMKRVGLGLVLHITPSNIPTNFAYSFVFGLISGNANIVRLSQKTTEQDQIILKNISQLFKRNKYKKLKENNAFVRYQQDDIINSYLCSYADAKVVWGGNKTVEYFKNIKSKPKIREVFFPDRFSIGVLDANKLKLLNEQAFKQLIKNFYNDTYLVDQNACSSPRLIVWLNDKTNKMKKKFWSSLKLRLNNYDLTLSRGYEKILTLYDFLSGGKYEMSSDPKDESIFVVKVSSLEKLENLSKLKLGIFLEYDAKALDEVFKIDMPALQTLSYFGLKKEQMLKCFNKQKNRAFDRIVPMGTVLGMDMNWDGYTIPYTLSRVINLE